MMPNLTIWLLSPGREKVGRRDEGKWWGRRRGRGGGEGERRGEVGGEMEREERRSCVSGRERTIKGGGELWRGGRKREGREGRKGGGRKRDDQIKMTSLAMSFLN